jgi:hypothetical protein
MKIAYLILAHGHFEHLVRIINALCSPDTSFFIHIDRRTEVDYTKIESKLSNEADVYLIDRRLEINWGGFSMVEGIVNLMLAAIQNDRYDYVSLLSGQDFPIVHELSIRSFLKEHSGSQFVEYFKIPDYSV